MKRHELIAIAVVVVILGIVVVLIANGNIGSSEAASGQETGAKCGGPYVGLSTKEAIAQAEENDARWRIGSRDGKVYPATLDYDPTRVTFDIEDGKVTNATCG